MTARLSTGGSAPTVVNAGNQTGAYSYSMSAAHETWIEITLTGSLTATLTGLMAGQVVRFIVTQDGTGGRLFTVSDGSVSVDVATDDRASKTTFVTAYTPDGTELVVTGGATTKAAGAQTASYTLLSTDVGRVISFNTATNVTLTVPSGSFAPGDVIKVVQLGVGQVLFGAAASVAVMGAHYGLNRGGMATLTNVGTDKWTLTGDTVATTSYDPMTVTGLTMWLKADALSLADGAVVGTWTDSSSGAHNATQGTTANKPTFQLGGRNGLPAVRFDGTNDSLAATGIINDTAARTIFVVAGRNSGSSSGTYWHLNDNAMVDDNGSGHSTYLRNEAAGTVDFGAIATTNVVAVRFNTTASADGYINGGSATNFNPNDVYQSPGSNNFTLGLTASGVRPFPGDICEVLIYNAAVIDANVTAITTYLKTKWGIA